MRTALIDQYFAEQEVWLNSIIDRIKNMGETANEDQDGSSDNSDHS